jgi:hypothetical protein
MKNKFTAAIMKIGCIECDISPEYSPVKWTGKNCPTHPAFFQYEWLTEQEKIKFGL